MDARWCHNIGMFIYPPFRRYVYIPTIPQYLMHISIYIHPKTLIEIATVYGSFDEQRLFSVKFARFRNFFDFAATFSNPLR